MHRTLLLNTYINITNEIILNVYNYKKVFRIIIYSNLGSIWGFFDVHDKFVIFPRVCATRASASECFRAFNLKSAILELLCAAAKDANPNEYGEWQNIIPGAGREAPLAAAAAATY